MSLFASYGRDRLRRTYGEAWAKYRAGAALTPLEALIAELIALHPEYQRLIEHTDRSLAFETAVEAGENPFLHLGLHIALREQLAIDRPPGIRELHRQLAAEYPSAHDADHVLMEALAQTLWEAQRAGRAPDELQYLALARRRLAGRQC